jgi:hypothetical protein
LGYPKLPPPKHEVEAPNPAEAPVALEPLGPNKLPLFCGGLEGKKALDTGGVLDCDGWV